METNNISKSNINIKNKSNKSIFIWFIFIFSTVVLISCFCFLEFWYSKRNGLQDGFHILNTDYSVIYWFSHISYLSCLFVVIWSGFETASLYNNKYKPKFIYKYFAIFWIVMTMVGEALLLPSMMRPRFEVIISIVDSSNWNSSEYWFGIEGFFYSFIDFFQFISIHITIPILVVVYASIYKDNEVEEKDVNELLIVMASFLLIWYIGTGIFTLIGMRAPYPIVDWGDWKNGWNIYVQLLLSVLGFIFVLLITYISLIVVRKNSNIEERENQ